MGLQDPENGGLPRMALPSSAGAVQSTVLSQELTVKLGELSQRRDVTLYMTLLAAFQVLLMRHSGQEDVLVMTSTPRRDEREQKGPPNLLPNTLVMRANLSGNPRFTDLLTQVRDVVLGAFEHRDLPPQARAEAVPPDRTAGDARISRVRFDVQSAAPGRREHANDQDRPPDVSTDSAHADLAMTVTESDECLRVEIKYRADLFSLATAERWLKRWRVLLESITDGPETTIGRLRLLPADERSLLLSEWCQTKRSTPKFSGVHQMVEAWAERTPDSIALVHENVRLTYRELNARANQVAHWLRGYEIGPDVGVGFYGDRSIDVITGILGTLKAGGYYIPLDVAYPEARIRDIVSDASPRVILTQRKLTGRLRHLFDPDQVSIIAMDSLENEISSFPTKNPGLVPHHENLVYVLHTSGSTGRPKGVGMQHGALLRIVDWYSTETGIAAGSHLLQFSSLGFDASFCEIFGGWHAGARVVLLPRDDMRQDPEALLELMERERIEHLEAPYSGLLNIAHWAVRHDSVRSLRLATVVTGGEQLLMAPDLVRWLEQMPGCALRNGYGPSETSVATTHWLRGQPGGWPQLPPIGRPITDARVYLLDEAMAPVPIGVTGEVYVGGDIVARGYPNRPGLTAGRFVADPFGAEPGRRLYRTGDFARYRDDGNLEFLGRIDNQVKIRGYRIELGEIEACLQGHPEVSEAAVAVIDGDTGKSLAAYVVARDPARFPSTGELREFAGRTLPGYMVPALYVTVAALPLTPSGKLDRGKLDTGKLAPVTAGQAEAEGTAGELSGTAVALLAIWREVLATPQIGMHDDFFELGGHSLLATRVISKVRTVIGSRVLIGDMFEYPTVAQLSARIDAREDGAGA
jgi:amino acid adenylation domain-containing protein